MSWVSLAVFLLVLFVLLFFLTLSLQLVDGVLRTVRHEFAGIVDAGPLGLPIVDVENPSWIEHVTASTTSTGVLIVYGREG